MTAHNSPNYTRSQITASRLGSGVAAGLTAGAAAGLVSRFAMRLVALELGMRAEFSLQGTIFLIFLGLIFGAVAGLIYIVLEGLISLPTLLKGLAWGSILLGISLLPVVFGEPEGELALLPPLPLAAVFLPVYWIYGLILAYTAAWLGGRSGR